MNYRSEIDGLRAIAILPVLLFHFGWETMSGGFLGVDIFFVISGYLITSIIDKELVSKKFSLVDFYERRARRILPALTVVLLFTTVFSFLLLSPQDLKKYSQSLVSVATFSSNFYFYLTSGYFASDSKELLLLHTWSLAVEEQFYVFFPFLLMLGVKIRKKNTVVIFFIILSFIFSLAIASSHSSANFYLITSRAWELLLGSIIALNYRKLYQVQAYKKSMLSMLGLALIFISLFIFTEQTLHPSWPTLMPILGVCLIISFSEGTYVARLLSHKFLVYIGLISYSLYLFHQPIIAFVKIKVDVNDQSMFLFYSFISTFILSYCCYKWVETPFRNKVKFSRVSIFRLSFYSLVFFIVVGLFGHIFDGYHLRMGQEIDTRTIQTSPKRAQCHTEGKNYTKPENACVLGGAIPSWAVLGDSHGVEISYALSNLLKEGGVKQLTFSGCPPAYTIDTNIVGCSKWLTEAIDNIIVTETIHNVLIAFRHSLYINGNQLSSKNSKASSYKPLRIGVGVEVAFDDTKVRKLYWQSFENIIMKLKEAGKNVVIVFPVPELKKHINKVIMPITMFHDLSQDLVKLNEYSFYQQRNMGVIEPLEKIVIKYDIQKLEPAISFCDDKFFSAVINGRVMYFDDNHLSVEGAAYVLETSKINFH